ncbi:MAG: EF-P beta-lysylation protein EpmB [Steroidobacteraceae bacterium]
MIAVSSQSNQTNAQATTTAAVTTLPGWQRALAQAITDPAELLQILQLDPALLSAAQAAAKLFPLRVPRGFVARMQPGNSADPLLQQVLPLGVELQETLGFTADPVGDIASRIAPGVLHKYAGRALLVATGACGVHCRYCFRRHFPYGDETASNKQWQEALAAVSTDTSIHEIILSGGDPLSLNNRRLRELSLGLTQIPHLKRLRIHTRQPVVLPERVDAEFLHWLDSMPLQKVMVLHINHAQEIDSSVTHACQLLTQHGVTLFNQSVLLKGINDSAATLAALSEALFTAGIQPYYLHLLDRVQGAAHFEVVEAAAQQLMREVVGLLPGFLVPKLVREVPGRTSKTPVPF